MTGVVRVTPWSGDTPPTREVLWQLMVEEGLSPHSWSNSPGDIYAAHAHGYDKVIYVVSGSITFGLPELKRSETLETGDRLELPKGTVHDAVVGSGGVVCLESHR